MNRQSVWIPAYTTDDFTAIDKLFETWLPSHSQIFLFGTGVYANAWHHYLMQCGVSINGFVVSTPSRICLESKEPVISLERFNALYEKGKTGLILTIDSDYYDEILPNLLFAFDDLFFLKERHKSLALRKSMSDSVKNNLKIAYLITNHCNLSCYGCDAASPIAKKSFSDASQVKRDFARLKQLMDDNTIDNISISGGEPLLHPQLTRILASARESFPHCQEINFFSNGLLLSEQSAKFWEALSAYDITVLWTKYPIHYKNEKDIYDAAKKYNVKLQLSPDILYSPKKSWWVGFDPSGKQKMWDWLFCYYHGFRIQVNDGRLYTCPMITTGEIVGRHFDVPLPVDESHSIDLYNVKSRDEIYDFLSQRPSFCDYCTIRERRIVGDWRHSKRERCEWLLGKMGE